MRTIGVRIRTRMEDGGYRHEVIDIGCGPRNDFGSTVSKDLVAVLKAVNERTYDKMPGGSRDLEILLTYRCGAGRKG
jgi:hypothetical protein